MFMIYESYTCADITASSSVILGIVYPLDSIEHLAGIRTHLIDERRLYHCIHTYPTSQHI